MNTLALSVGGLLYTPASNPMIANRIIDGEWPCLTSVCLCLEDSIQDNALDQAEEQMERTLLQLSQTDVHLPMLFIRVKSPDHLKKLHDRLSLSTAEGVLTGYVFPKFDLSNATAYLETLSSINSGRQKQLYAMPILESKSIAGVSTRIPVLGALREKLEFFRSDILNIRVGGNDFCNLFGLRRSVSQTIYDIGVVRDILSDIVNVFSDDYVLSGPVWEYYGKKTDAAWATGLQKELDLDIVNGFIGKTAIHPCQLPVIYEKLKVTPADAEDARQILIQTSHIIGAVKR